MSAHKLPKRWQIFSFSLLVQGGSHIGGAGSICVNLNGTELAIHTVVLESF